MSGNDCTNRYAYRCICCMRERLLRSPAILMPFLAKRIFNYDPIEITEEWGLRDIPKGMAYFLCNTVECQDCGVLFLDYRFSDDELSRLYNDYRGDDYNNMRIRFEPNYNATAIHYADRAQYLVDVESVLAPHVTENPKVLDWGGGSGINSPFRFQAASLHIYDVSGVSVCEEARRVSLEESRSYQYDLVVCSQVLEHVSYPLEVMKTLTSYLSPHTILYLEVPLEGIFHDRVDGISLCEKKRHWHEHINFFSPNSLVAMALCCSLDVLESKILPVSLGWRDGTIQMLVCKLRLTN